jgi:sulfite reductase (NADPH) flavoprotein alpha-component
MPDQDYLPEDAPFSSEQRVWLNDFIQKLLSEQAGGIQEPTGPAVPVTLLFGSQTGNSEGCAKKMAKAMKGGRFETEVFDMSQYDTSRLAQEKNLLVITSTYGDGEPPDGAADFYEWLLGETAPSLAGLRFSVLGLGDTEYPDFCKCAADMDERLVALGAERFLARVDCDVDYDEPFAQWREAVIKSLGGGSAASESEGERLEDLPYGKKRPFPASILRNFNLNAPEGVKETNHVEISLEGSGLSYEVGDALGVLARNPEEVVDEIIASLAFNTKEEVPLPGGGEASLREALLNNYEIRSLSPKLLKAWQEKSGSPYLRALVEADDKEAFNDFIWGRELIDLVTDYPADFSDGEDFVAVLKKLQPRLYSIASSPDAHPGEVHLTVGIVRYESLGRERGGVCSTFLADRCEGKTLGVFVHTNKAFRMPEDDATPIIMVGPGTGIAPFRAFLEDRKVKGSKGPCWLLFGNPYQATDFLYEEELTALQADGVLTRLDTAFSRDQAHKIYVQDRMIEQGAELWKWLSEGARFYVCGDASRMAKDVDAAMLKVVEEHGGMSAEEAAEYVKQMRKEKRYCRDVY